MKLWQIVGGTALSLTLAGCASHSAPPPPPPGVESTASAQTTIAQPAVTGTVNINQRIALPPNAVLTVTLSDASLADAPSRVIAQRVGRTEGKQAPFRFVLPYNPAEIQPNARIILSAAITIDGQMTFTTDTIKEVINGGQGTQADLQLTPVASIPINTKPSTMGPMDTSPNAPMPAPVNPAPAQIIQSW